MKNKNILAIIVVFLLIGVIRIIGIRNIPSPIIVVILILCIGVGFVSSVKYNGDKTERILLLIMTILLSLIFSLIIIWYIADEKYLQSIGQYKSIYITLIAVLYFITLILAITKAIYKYNKKKNK